MQTPRNDLTGKKFGNLVVLEYLGSRLRSGLKRGIWRCLCGCGNTTEQETNSLTSGHSKSCGCLKILANSAAGKQRRTHGMSKSKEYKLWAGMIYRATNEESLDYALYGPRGVYTPWEHSFEDFYAHIGAIPKDGKKYSLERVNNNIGYFPGNVIWLELPLQARNKGQYSNNKSGVTGVCFLKGRGKGRWAATWCDVNKKLRVKSFSVLKYGDEEAFNLAVEYRNKMLFELQKEGVFYSENHGKERILQTI